MSISSNRIAYYVAWLAGLLCAGIFHATASFARAEPHRCTVANDGLTLEALVTYGSLRIQNLGELRLVRRRAHTRRYKKSGKVVQIPAKMYIRFYADDDTSAELSARCGERACTEYTHE